MDLHISDLVKIYAPKKPKVFKPLGRRDWIYKFLVPINKDRYEQDRLSLMRMGRTLKRWQLWELPVIYKLCEESDNFCKTFWWLWKKKEPIKKEKKPKQISIWKN